MRIQTDGTITLEAREFRVLTEAAAIVLHIAKQNDGSATAQISAAEVLVAMAEKYTKPAPELPAPEPPDKGKGAKKGATDAAE